MDIICSVSVRKMKKFSLIKKYDIQLTGESWDGKRHERCYVSKVHDRLVVDIVIESSADDFISYEDDLRNLQKRMLQKYG